MNQLVKNSFYGLMALGLASAPQAFAGGGSPSDGWAYTGGEVKGVPKDINLALSNLVNLILGFITMIAVLVIIYGGVLYLTSMGNEDASKKAKQTIASGIIGLVICGLAYAIVLAVKTLLKTEA